MFEVTHEHETHILVCLATAQVSRALRVLGIMFKSLFVSVFVALPFAEAFGPILGMIWDAALQSD